MRRPYEKPVMTVERFSANVAAVDCAREWDGTTTVNWTSVEVHCYRSGDPEYLFSSGTSGCNNYPTGIVHITSGGTYTQQQLVNAGLTSLKVDEYNGDSVVIPPEGGYVLTWTNGRTNCYGPATPEIIQNMTSSY